MDIRDLDIDIDELIRVRWIALAGAGIEPGTIERVVGLLERVSRWRRWGWYAEAAAALAEAEASAVELLHAEDVRADACAELAGAGVAEAPVEEEEPIEVAEQAERRDSLAAADEAIAALSLSERVDPEPDPQPRN